jgi:hypothetical protein
MERGGGVLAFASVLWASEAPLRVFEAWLLQLPALYEAAARESRRREPELFEFIARVLLPWLSTKGALGIA